MELTFQVIFIIIAILIVLSIWFLIIKYFLYPLFFKPELKLIETFDFFKSKNLVFIEKRELKKAEMKINPFNYKSGLSFKKMFQTVFWFIIKTSQCCSLFYDWFYSLGHYLLIYFLTFNVLPLFL